MRSVVSVHISGTCPLYLDIHWQASHDVFQNNWPKLQEGHWVANRIPQIGLSPLGIKNYRVFTWQVPQKSSFLVQVKINQVLNSDFQDRAVSCSKGPAKVHVCNWV